MVLGIGVTWRHHRTIDARIISGSWSQVSHGTATEQPQNSPFTARHRLPAHLPWSLCQSPRSSRPCHQVHCTLPRWSCLSGLPCKSQGSHHESAPLPANRSISELRTLGPGNCAGSGVPLLSRTLSPPSPSYRNQSCHASAWCACDSPQWSFQESPWMPGFQAAIPAANRSPTCTKPSEFWSKLPAATGWKFLQFRFASLAVHQHHSTVIALAGSREHHLIPGRLLPIDAKHAHVVCSWENGRHDILTFRFHLVAGLHLLMSAEHGLQVVGFQEGLC